MKLFSKVLCILSVLVLCVPFFCLSVSAAEADDDEILPPYYGIDTFKANADGSGFKMKAEDIDANGLPLFYQKNYIDTDVTEGEKESLYGEVVSDKTFIKPPYYIDGTNAVNAQDEYVMFTRSLEAAVDYNDMVMTTSNEYYYFTFFYEYSAVTPSIWDSGDYEYTDRIVCNCFTYISETPITFTSTSNGFVLNGSEKYIGFVKWESHEGKYDDEPFNWMYSAMGKGFQSVSNIVFDSSILYAHYDSSSYSLDYQSKCYTNCNIDTSMFDSDENLVKGISEFEKGIDIAKNIEVTLTPNFGANMDRSVEGSTFGMSEDYWSIEVANNNDFDIQFVCAIVTDDSNYISPNSGADYIKERAEAENIPILLNYDSNIPNVYDIESDTGNCDVKWKLQKDQWVYALDVTNVDNYYKEVPRLVNKPTAQMFVKSGTAFKQVISWEQLDLNKKVDYKLLVYACECPYDRASEHYTSLASDDYDQSCKQIPTESFFFIKEIEFSVTNPLSYNPSNNTGGAIANTGDEDYYRINAYEDDTGEIVIANKDYKAYIDSASVDYGDFVDGGGFDIDSASPDDVLEYLDFTKNYFNLIGSVLGTFPDFIWGLIAFGLSAFVVIAIAKWIIT